MQDLDRCPEYRVRRGHVADALYWLCRHNPFYADVRVDEATLSTLPADAVPAEFGVVAEGPADLLQQGPADAQFAAAEGVELPAAAAVLDVEGEDVLPPEQWRQALLGGDRSREGYALAVPHGELPLDSFQSSYWAYCFPVLFPYADSLPGANRIAPFGLRRLARHLLLRRDRHPLSNPWAMDLDFVATLFSVLHRRDLLQAVRARVAAPGFAQHARALAHLSHADFELLAQLLGHGASVREALRPLVCLRSSLCTAGNPAVPAHLRSALRTMQLVSRRVPCTDSYRDTMRQQIQALQIWVGLPAVFVTVNPADTRHPFTLRFGSTAAWPTLSPDAGDDALHAALSGIQLAHLVARDPIGVARAFHQHIRSFLEDIVGVASVSDALPPDGIAATSFDGVLGAVAAVYGVVEPQMRGSLHCHMLVHLYGFNTAEALVAKFQDRLPALASQLLAWSQTISITALEAVPAALGLHFPVDVFRHLQPMPLPPEQQALARQALGCQLDWDAAPRVWRFGAASQELAASEPWLREPLDGSLPPHLPWPSLRMCKAAVSAQQWLRMLLIDLRHAALHSCLHRCRRKTCHKGRLGKLGYCRLGFWHWRDVSAHTAPDTFQRVHGHQLQAAAAISEAPLRAGELLPQRHHPYHCRFNPAILALTKANHDVSILIRSPVLADHLQAAEIAAAMATSAKAATFYITAYISKTQPHLANLWLLLRDGQRRLEQEHASAPSAPAPQRVASRTLTRMLTSAEKRVHKSLPELAHYLLGHAEHYTTHTFRPLYITPLLHRAHSLCAVETLRQHAAPCTFLLPQVDEDGEADGAVSAAAHVPQDVDYGCRGQDLRRWPFYFYVAGVRKCLAHHPPPGACYARYSVAHPHHDRSCQRILTTTAWAVPQLCGFAIPPRERDPELHCLLLLLLFKPWSSEDLSDLLADSAGNTATTWAEAFQAFYGWLTAIAAASLTQRPEPFSEIYWCHRCSVCCVSVPLTRLLGLHCAHRCCDWGTSSCQSVRGPWP